jgi:hypothetical protein
VKGRGIATVVAPEEDTRMNHGAPRSDPNSARGDVIAATRYVRVWTITAGFDYLINLPDDTSTLHFT